ncbi:UNVERIFIED_CONTAM: hypothetical protein Sangu_0088800 [Sesamum angustifolium]|uniref:Reverse transcriptase domain-containing protein n=1 Tax=Sesamum angustifolium TaxID=2727405 RepID=A0AAW2RJN5_9LAMI
MSPALFLLCMEYFSRLIKRSTTNSDFNFHPKCEKLKITHLLFADDLMLFSRGDLPSIRILMECLQEFRDVSGLAVNNAKSNIFTAGIQNDTLDEALAMTDFARGHMPVRYLGIPLSGSQSQITHRWEWSAFGSKSSLSQWQSLRRSIVCAGPSYGILSVHRWHGRIFAIQRRKAVWVFGISNPGTLLSLPESYGTFIARQTPYGSSGSMRFTFGGPHFGTGSRRRTILHYFDDLPRSGTELSLTSAKLPKQPWKALFGRHSYRPNTHSFLEYGRGWQHETDLHSYMRTQPAPCALIVRNRPNIFSLNAPSAPMFGRISDSGLHHPTNVNPSQCSKVAQEREDWLLCAEQSAALALACTVYSLWRHRNEIILKAKLQIPTAL